MRPIPNHIFWNGFDVAWEVSRAQNLLENARNARDSFRLQHVMTGGIRPFAQECHGPRGIYVVGYVFVCVRVGVNR